MRVIILAFANNQYRPLKQLSEEDEAINDILYERYAMGDFLIIRESFATTERLNRLLYRHRDNLCIFHFGGHAGGNGLQMNNGMVFSGPLATQLGYSAQRQLKLVILNGCSTCSQVKELLGNQVPAIISTSAPIEDISAKEFAVRFWQNMVTNDFDLEKCYQDAISAAASVSNKVSSVVKRHLVIDDVFDCKEDKPLWSLDVLKEDFFKIKPIPYKDFYPTDSQPNVKLIETLYKSFYEANNPKIVELWEKEHREINPEDIPIGTLQIAIVNSIPFPIGIHLQKLICPSSDVDGEGYDEFSIMRLIQIAELYHITTEFLAIIMIAQVWELNVRFERDFKIDDAVKTLLKEYVQLGEKERETFDYLPLIESIREYLQNLEPKNTQVGKFLKEQEILHDLVTFDENFKNACAYLSNIRCRTINRTIGGERIKIICSEAENKLCDFIQPLGFIHKYLLTSIQNIDIWKLRHFDRKNTVYKHFVIRCMSAIGTDQRVLYLMETYLDNWGVILLKIESLNSERIGKRIKTKVKVKDYLNLSPFVIDLNSFGERNDLANIMFYKDETNETIRYRKVKKPSSQRDAIDILKSDEKDDKFDAVREQFFAFKNFIA